MLDVLAKIEKIDDCVLSLNADLTSYTTFRLKSQGHLLEVKSVLALQKILPILSSHNVEYIVLGWGANQILPENCEGFVIHLDFPFDDSYLSEIHEEYDLPASLGINHLTAHAAKFGLKGWEVFTGIPASLGGAIYMNAGTNLGEIGSLIKSVDVVSSTGVLRREVISANSFSYRKNYFVKPGEIIVSVRMVHLGLDESISQKIKDYLDYRKKTQPLATKNCGCVFKNPARELQAGRLIDLIGLKGLEVGKLRISPKHANFMENMGGANWDHFSSLINVIKFEMDHFYGIEFEMEVKIPYH